MAKKSMIARENKRARMVARYAGKRAALKAIQAVGPLVKLLEVQGRLTGEGGADVLHHRHEAGLQGGTSRGEETGCVDHSSVVKWNRIAWVTAGGSSGSSDRGM